MSDLFADIKVGDKVGEWTTDSSYDDPLLTVEHVTAKHFYAGGERWRKDTGHRVGDAKAWKPRVVETADFIQRQRNASLNTKIREMLARREWSFETLKQIESLLDADE